MTKFEYTRDEERHHYGKSERLPSERLLVRHINEMHTEHPGFRMQLLGTSGVLGESFPVFRTRCTFVLEDEAALEACWRSLQESDELIRRRIAPAWSWEMAWVSGTTVMFFVNWYDFAYFMKHKQIFMGKDHSRYAMDFGLNVGKIDYAHYKIFRSGDEAEFDIDKISEREREIVAHLDQIEFERKFREPRF